MTESPAIDWAMRLRNCDRAQLGIFYRKYAPRIYALAYSHCREQSTAEDIMQSAFVGLVNALRAGRAVDNPVGYLVQAVRNRSASTRRVAQGAGVEEEPASANDPANEVQRHEQARQLWEAVALLPQEQREIVYLHVGAGLTFEAIAKTVDVPLGTALKRYYNALERLKHKLKDMP